MYTLFDWKQYSAQYGSLALDDKDPEPSILISGQDAKVLLSIKSSGIEYNRKDYTNDTAQQAAERVYRCIMPLHKSIRQPEIHWTLHAYNKYPERVFKVSHEGIEHNFDVDVWHWWMLDYLTKLVKGDAILAQR